METEPDEGAAGAGQGDQQPQLEIKDPDMEEITPMKRGPVYPSYRMLIEIEKSADKEKNKVNNEKLIIMKEDRTNTAAIRQYESDLKGLTSKKRTINRKLWEKDREMRRLESGGLSLRAAIISRRMGHTPEPNDELVLAPNVAPNQSSATRFL